MIRLLLIAAGAFNAGLGLYLLAAPEAFYLQTPGVNATGPFNAHFLRDVGLAFLISGAALGFGAARGERTPALFGASFPAAHGAYHLQIWVAGGCAPDPVSLMELGVIILPSFLVLGLVLSTRQGDGRGLKGEI